MFRQPVKFVRCPLRKIRTPSAAGDAIFANALPQDQLPVVRTFLAITPLISVRTADGFEVLDTHLLSLARLAFRPGQRIVLAVLSTAPDDKSAAHLAAFAARAVVHDLSPHKKALLAWRLLQLPREILTSNVGASDQRTLLQILRVNERTFRRRRPK